MQDIEKIIKNNKGFDELINTIDLGHQFLCCLDKIEDPDYIHERYVYVTDIIANLLDDLIYDLTEVYSDNEDAFSAFWYDWNNKESLTNELIRTDILDGVKTFLEAMEDE